MHKRYSNLYIIAKDSLISDNLTKELSDFGMGFDYKLHTGFTKEIITYFHYDPNERKYHYNELFELTLGMYCEKHVLALLNSQFGNSEVGGGLDIAADRDAYPLDLPSQTLHQDASKTDPAEDESVILQRLQGGDGLCGNMGVV